MHIDSFVDQETHILKKIFTSCFPVKVPYSLSQIVDPETGKELGPHQNGELLIRGPTVMKGYFNAPSAEGGLDVDHWVHTGMWLCALGPS